MKNRIKSNYRDLYNNLTEILKTHEILREYKSNNLIKSRVELYKDFTINLCFNMIKTYLGPDYINTRKVKEEHFAWCFNKICEDFKMENIDFSKNKELYDYFLEYYISTVYDNHSFELDFLIEYWDNTLNLSYNKTKSDIDGLVEVYKIFDKTIENKI